MFGARSRLALVLAGAYAAMPAVAMAQRLGGAADTPISWWRVIAAFVICVLLALGAAFALRLRLKGSLSPSTERRIRLVDSLRLTHQIDVCLVEVEGKSYIFGAGPSGIVRLDGPSEIRPEAEATGPVAR